MSKSPHDMKSMLASEGSSAKSGYADVRVEGSIFIFTFIFNLRHPIPLAYLEAGDRDFKSEFIDTLTTIDEHERIIPGAEAKVQAMRNMRFKPTVLHRDQNTRDQYLRTDGNSPFYTENGVTFLKPMQNQNEIKFNNFSPASRVQVVDNRSWWSSFKRGVSMFFQSLTILGGIRLFSKMKQILPGTFGYAMNMNGDIEIYPASTEATHWSLPLDEYSSCLDH